MAGAIPVGMSEIRISRQELDVLSAMGLGSCIGLCMYDPTARVAGMAHVMLPESRSGSIGSESLPGKFADTAVPALLQRMERVGASRARLRVAIAGGAEVFASSSVSPILAIGRRNAEAVRAAVQRIGLRLTAEDVGGSTGRTVVLEAATGLVQVRMVGGKAADLVCLGQAR